MPKTITFFLVLAAAALAITPALHSQSLPLGTMTLLGNDPIPCTAEPNGSKFYAGMNCFTAQIVCPNTANIQVIFGYTGPSEPVGTIVFFPGGKGTSPTEDGDDIPTYLPGYVNQYVVVQLEYPSPREDPSSDGSGGNILNAACRPATFLNWINSNLGVHPQGALCAQGSSAGSAAVTYAMTWYGLANLLANVELESGPVLSEIDKGCTYPNYGTPTLCGAGDNAYCSTATKLNPWTDADIYVPSYNQAVSNWSGLPACGTSGVNPANYPTWAAMSIVNGSASGYSPTFNFSNTPIHGWVCAGYSSCSGPSCPNNSASEGKWFYDAVNGAEGLQLNMTLTGVQACAGAEGVAEGTDPDSGKQASVAIQSDMESKCHI